MATINAEIKVRVDATEQAKKKILLWFASYKEIPKLDERLTNFSTWRMAIKSSCEKQNCLKLLANESHLNDKLGLNNCKNVNMLIAHSIDEDIKMYVLKKTACGLFQATYNLRLKSNKQQVTVLDKVSRIDSIDISDYVRQVQRLQGQLMRLDPEREHHESKDPAHMTRLQDTLAEEQMEKVSFLRTKKWRCREKPHMKRYSA